MPDPLTLTTDTRGLATVTLNRPEVHNAFNDALIAALTDAFAKLGQDAQVRAILLTGAGKSFSAGADLNWMRQAARSSEAENKADALRLSDMLATLDACPKPTLARVNGAAMGGGVGLVACCDMAVGLHDARFALSEVRLGLTPATISPFVIAKIGAAAARRYFLTGERFTGERAWQLGLLSGIADDEPGLDMAVETLVEQLLAGAPGAQAQAKRLIADIANRPIDDALRRDTADRIAARRASPEGQEGLSAFLDKRKPSWATG